MEIIKTWADGRAALRKKTRLNTGSLQFGFNGPGSYKLRFGAVPVHINSGSYGSIYIYIYI